MEQPSNEQILHEQGLAPRLELLTNGVPSSSFTLYSFQVCEERHERVISWFDQSNNLLIKHLVPRGKVPYTKNTNDFMVTYRDMRTNIGRVHEQVVIFHGFEFPATPSRTRMLIPRYYFSTEQQSVRFQCAARQRQLLQTFETDSIRAHGYVSHGQQLKVWQKSNEPTVTFTFFAHRSVEPVAHYEFDLLWFRREVRCSGAKVLILTFYTRSDERSKSVDSGIGKLFSLWGGQSTNQMQSDGHSRRPSFNLRHPNSASRDFLLPGGERVVTENLTYLDWKRLHIEFMDENDVSRFIDICHDPDIAPGPQMAPESLWKVSPGSDDTFHLLQPVAGALISTRRPPFRSPADPDEEDAAFGQAQDWLERLHGIKGQLFHGPLDDGVPPVKICVLDTGIDSKNPYLAAWKKKSQSTERYRNFLEDSTVAEDLSTEPYSEAYVAQTVSRVRKRPRDSPQDNTGHGTHVSGIIVELCPEANLFVGRVLDENVTEEENETSAAARRLALALLYATDVWKVKIISLSIGFRKALLSEQDKMILRNAIRYATSKEVLIFAAASNDGNRDRILFPASEPEPFCINSSNGNGHASAFNPPRQEYDENFSILGEGVRSTWLQEMKDLSPGEIMQPSLKVRRGTSVATPIAACVSIIIIHFGRQWEPIGHEKLETRRGIRCILRSMVPHRNIEKFYDIVPWLGVFELLTTRDQKDPVEAAKTRIEERLEAAY
ncbi:unnamed protein product [Periconia digitata]|uniref:Peptidase S8/S53 domain-containing protein n=1 Tax=Periconia digitata TaxID=1303443 RepID=A0A9W4UKW6_9PLEO|nr:unnamed protein product [Periconia digitata]